MNRPFRMTLLMVAVSCFLSTALSADTVPAFPGAEGFGAAAVGGRGGRVMEVTNLRDSGEGSFRAACEASGQRIIVFRTGGTIEVRSPIVITEPFVTIAGQTAPGDGILLKADPSYDGAVIQVATHEVIVRGLRIRRGPTKKKGCCGDGLSIHNSKGNPHHIIVDHCSISWSTDENTEAWYSASDITIQWCLISEALHNSSHEKGPHSKGTLMGADVRRVSYHHNLLAHNVARNPLFNNNGGPDHVVNNVIYNWMYLGSEFSKAEEVAPHVNLIGNTYRAGPDTRTVRYEVALSNYPKEPLFYVRDNIGHHRPDAAGDEWSLVGDSSSGLGDKWMRVAASRKIQRQHPWPDSPIPIRIQPSGVAYNDVLEGAGAIAPRRDPVDVRVVNDVRKKSGRCIDDPSDVGGWPTLDPGEPPVDADHDGMPDEWEKQHGLDPGDADDRNRKTADGCTRVEQYINSLIPMRPAVGSGAGVSSGRSMSVVQTIVDAATREVLEMIRPRDIRHDRGKAYTATLRAGRVGDRDGKSLCTLRENGKPLSEPRSRHDRIGQLGNGRYSHWTESTLWFSASDSSDPRTNGRRYELVSRESYARKLANVKTTTGNLSFAIRTDDAAKTRMLRVKLRNLDKRVAVVPKLLRQGDPDMTSIDAILTSVLREGMTAEQECLALWKLLVDWRYHDYPAENGSEVHDPVKLLNVYGYGFCDDSAEAFCGLADAVGFKTRIHGLTGHVVAEAFYDEGWHMFDPDHKVVYRTDDGSVASVDHLARHPGIITATPTDPLGSKSKDIARLYTSLSDNHSRPADLPRSRPIRLVLQPTDEVVFGFSVRDRVHRRKFTDKPLPSRFANGVLTQTRRLSRLPGGAGGRLLGVRWPYAIVGGKIMVASRMIKSGLTAEVSVDREHWSALAFTSGDDGSSSDLSEWVDAQDSATYGYWIRFKTKDAVDPAPIVGDVQLRTEFQFAPRSHPQIQLGMNRFELTVTPIDGQSLIDWAGLAVELDWEETFSL